MKSSASSANSDMTTALQSVNGCIPCKCLNFWRRQHIYVASVPRDVPIRWTWLLDTHWYHPALALQKMLNPWKWRLKMHVHETLLKSLQNIAKWCFQFDFGDDNFRPCWKHPALWISWAPPVFPSMIKNNGQQNLESCLPQSLVGYLPLPGSVLEIVVFHNETATM
jgi:hypothetical protein